jgi:hypothetical protein
MPILHTGCTEALPGGSTGGTYCDEATSCSRCPVRPRRRMTGLDTHVFTEAAPAPAARPHPSAAASQVRSRWRRWRPAVCVRRSAPAATLAIEHEALVTLSGFPAVAATHTVPSAAVAPHTCGRGSTAQRWSGAQGTESGLDGERRRTDSGAARENKDTGQVQGKICIKLLSLRFWPLQTKS